MRQHFSRLLLAMMTSMALSGCLKPTAPLPTPGPAPAPTPLPQPSIEHTDAEFYSALGKRIAAGKVDDTDEVLLIVSAAAEAGDVRDASKIDTALPTARTTNQLLTPANRDSVANALKGLR